MSAYTTVEDLLDALDIRDPDLDTKRKVGELITRVSARLDRVLGFTFGDESLSLPMDGSGSTLLYLPAPGAINVATVIENGVTLSPYEYRLDAQAGQFLLRLDTAGKAVAWTYAEMGVTIDYTPNPAPPDLEDLCLTQCVRAWQGKAAGYSDVVGVEGANSIGYRRAFAAGTTEALQNIARTYGVRNLVAV